MIVLAGVDGTGTADAAAYRTEFARSHVRVLTQGWRHGPACYLRGPSDLGFETKGLAGAAASFIVGHVMARKAAGLRTGVFLTGYSRGGAAVLDACRQLFQAHVMVDCLMLFDAVDRTHTTDVDGELIPGNVRACFHAIRDPAVMSRAWFGNCGRRCELPLRTAYTERMFRCTHGGVGGTPWKEGKGLLGNVAESHGWVDVGGNFGQTALYPVQDVLESVEIMSWCQEVLGQAVGQTNDFLAQP
jgi:hypothetical protein